MTINWREKGRERASRMIEYAGLFTETSRADAIRITAERVSQHEGWLRDHFADLLAAVRWGADDAGRRNMQRIGCALSKEHCAAEAEAEALRLLIEGFRSRLAEIAEGRG